MHSFQRHPKRILWCIQQLDANVVFSLSIKMSLLRKLTPAMSAIRADDMEMMEMISWATGFQLDGTKSWIEPHTWCIGGCSMTKQTLSRENHTHWHWQAMQPSHIPKNTALKLGAQKSWDKFRWSIFRERETNRVFPKLRQFWLHCPFVHLLT